MVKTKQPFLITGGCGFVGRNLLRKLINQGRDIWIIDDLSVGRHPSSWLEEYVKAEEKDVVSTFVSSRRENKIIFVNSDIIDLLYSDIKGTGSVELPEFSDIFHLASIVGGRVLIDGDPVLIARDFAIDSVFFNWITRNKNKVKRVIYASSGAAYPVHLQIEGDSVALKEEYISFDKKLGMPDMTYGWSKLTGEFLSRLAAEKYGIHVACIRPFSGYGEDQDFSYPVPAIAKRVAQREDPLTVWGTGKQGRDFVHIEDCVDAFFVILDNIKDGSGCNIGTGKLTSFLEVLKIFSKFEGYSPEIKPLPDKPVGVGSRYADTTLINSFGWEPKISIQEGFSRVLNYVKEKRLEE